MNTQTKGIFIETFSIFLLCLSFFFLIDLMLVYFGFDFLCACYSWVFVCLIVLFKDREKENEVERVGR